ncbi:GntR family transcriptional regulator [Enterovibrio sp. ZSDZ42]|uniref:GntR family transcriptional regulator n=1 Tax=Enterovibrio gelatinilyticus TaxID=2899819 RepID=A0ABT5R614_9GAMM|nr:GntR family transcriptional regulator [Enterovibrio sp. ZSDZ42]MDD1795709.1 GntR family transcriptional regulator [Enterovibrio sp. ZSDZ42]
MSVLGVSQKEREIFRIMDAINLAVCDQRLPPGTRLIESQLVNTFDANRNHVRAAIQRLALRRIVTISPNKGASVSAPQLDEAQDVLAARALIEKGVIEQLVTKVTDKDLLKLERHLALESQAMARGDRLAIIKRSGEFHTLLATLNGNQVLSEILRDLITRSSLIIAIYQREQQMRCGCTDHQALVTAIEQKDELAAISLMASHLKDIELSLNLDFWKNKTVNLSDVFQ